MELAGYYISVAEHVGSKCAGRSRLTHLLEAGFIETGKSRDKDSGQWVLVNKQESLAAVAGLRSDFRWSSANQLWELQPNAPRIEILGLNTTQKILREEGWPPELD